MKRSTWDMVFLAKEPIGMIEAIILTIALLTTCILLSYALFAVLATAALTPEHIRSWPLGLIILISTSLVSCFGITGIWYTHYHRKV